MEYETYLNKMLPEKITIRELLFANALVSKKSLKSQMNVINYYEGVNDDSVKQLLKNNIIQHSSIQKGLETITKPEITKMLELNNLDFKKSSKKDTLIHQALKLPENFLMKNVPSPYELSDYGKLLVKKYEVIFFRGLGISEPDLFSMWTLNNEKTPTQLNIDYIFNELKENDYGLDYNASFLSTLYSSVGNYDLSFFYLLVSLIDQYTQFEEKNTLNEQYGINFSISTNIKRGWDQSTSKIIWDFESLKQIKTMSTASFEKEFEKAWDYVVKFHTPQLPTTSFNNQKNNFLTHLYHTEESSNHYQNQQLKVKDFVALDIETTGLNISDQIIRISAVKIKNGIETDYFDSLVYADIPISKKIENLTHISQEDVNVSPKYKIVADKLNIFINNLPVVGHNINSFDKPRLANIGVKLGETIDTLQIAKNEALPVPNFKLITLSEYFNIQINAHDSLSDSRASARVLMELLSIDYSDDISQSNFFQKASEVSEVSEQIIKLEDPVTIKKKLL